MPCVAVVGGVPEITGGRFDVGAVTAMENAARLTVFGPSLTEIRMLLNDVPAAEDGGVPDKRPVPVSNAAQVGRFMIEKSNELPSGSLAVGTNV